MLKSIEDKVYYRDWSCNDPNAAIILIHGLGGHSERFFELGPYLSEAGIKPYAIELNGFGDSPSIKGHIGNFKIFTDELLALIHHVKKENPGKRVFLLGESLGAGISLDFCLGNQEQIDGIILISPSLKNKAHLSLLRKMSLAYNAIFNPLNYHYAFFEAKLFTRDKEIARKIESDPLELRSFSAMTFIQISLMMFLIGIQAKKITLPVLMLLAGQDKMISVEKAASYFTKIASKDKAIKIYPEMFHALYLDIGREKVFSDIADWLKKHL